MTKEAINNVKKRDGRIVPFEKEKITQAIFKAAQATVEFGEKESKRLADVVVNILIKTTNSLTPEVEQIQDIVESVLVAANHYPTAKAYILYRQKRSQARQARKIIGVEDNLKLPLNVLKVIERRYLRHDEFAKPIETPLQMLARVAKAVASAERNAQAKKKWQQRFFELVKTFRFVPGGCYFRGAGTPSGQIANCFVLPVEDSLEAIFDAVKWTALIHKSGGGTGFNFSHLRPKGDKVGRGGLASGPVSFIHAFDAATDVVMRGGFHQGANMGILNADHPDIFEFISAKESGEIQNFNISVGAPDAFLKAVEQDLSWDLVNPRNREVVQTISAQSLFDQIATLAWRTGDPGLIFLDRINQDNPVPKLGPIEATNVCGEQPLHSFDACNLGSLDLARFVNPHLVDFQTFGEQDLKKAILWNQLEEVTRTAIRFLDNGIDIGKYPLKQITKMVKANRRVGLGVMGFADLLYQLKVPYDSEQGVKAAVKLMGFVNEVAVDESKKLAKEKGLFPNWRISVYQKKKIKRRNSAVTTIAPTGVISMVADTSSGIEPVFGLAFVKDVVEESGLFYVNKHFQKALEQNNYYSFELVREIARTGSIQRRDDLARGLKRIFVTAHDISWQWHVKMQAAFQSQIENAVSKTINFPHSAAVEEVASSYLLAWKSGCKGITIYRDGSKDGQILKLGEGGDKSSKPTKERIQSKLKITPLKTVNQKGNESPCPECGRLMVFEEGCLSCRVCGYSKCEL